MQHEYCEEDLLRYGPQSVLERELLEEYLVAHGHHLHDLDSLPESVARELMRGACQYAALKLAEIESRSHFRKTIEAPGA